MNPSWISEEMSNRIIQKAWEDAEFRDRLLRKPKEVLAEEFQLSLPENVTIQILEEEAKRIHIVLPSI